MKHEGCYLSFQRVESAATCILWNGSGDGRSVAEQHAHMRKDLNR